MGSETAHDYGHLFVLLKFYFERLIRSCCNYFVWNIRPGLIKLFHAQLYHVY